MGRYGKIFSVVLVLVVLGVVSLACGSGTDDGIAEEISSDKLLIEDREELRPIVAAYLERSVQESQWAQSRFNELAGFPVLQQQAQFEEGVQKAAVEPTIDYLLGITTQEGYVDALIDSAIDEMRAEEESRILMEFMGEDSVRTMMRGMLAYSNQIVAQGESRPVTEIKFINASIMLAQDKGVSAQGVFRDDGLYKELVRSVYTSEEFRIKAEQIFFSFLDEESVFDFILPLMEAIVAPLGLSEEESAKMLVEMEQELKTDPEFKAQLEKMRGAAGQIVDEMVQRYFE